MKRSSPPLRVLHIIQGKHFGGAEQVVLTLVRSFDQEQVLPLVLCLSDGLFKTKLMQAGIRCFLVPMKSKKDIFSPVIATIRLIRKERVDIVHTHTVRSNLIGRMAAFLSGRKCLTHLHSPVARDFADLKRGRLNEFVDSITRPVASHYIAVSNSLRHEMIANGMAQHTITTIHNAVDVEALRLNTHSKAGMRGEYGIPEEAFVMVMVALLRPRKGPDLLIGAMKKVLAVHPNAFLLIVGNDDISEEPGFGNKLHRMSEELGLNKNIFFTGFRNDVPAVLKQCDMLVLPSRFGEGLPMVMLEAMASGLPVVASSVEGVPEVIEDGVHGFLVPPGDSEALADKIIGVVNDPFLRKRVAEAGQQRVLSCYDRPRQARQVEELYRKVLLG